MAKIERNAPCPCGSGSKYKKCCLAKDEAAAWERVQKQRDAEAIAARELAAFEARYRAAQESGADADGSWVFDEDGLDKLSNSVIDFINERRFDEALEACRRLLEEFPEVVDGFDRYAAVYEAMGEFEKARDFYQLALDFTLLPEQRSGFDEDGRAWRRDKIAESESRIGNDT